jgi:SAM-dependent methyltransferase
MNRRDQVIYAELCSQRNLEGTDGLVFRNLPDLLPFSERGEPALDLGCGTGRSARFLAEMGYKVSGVDRNPMTLRTALSLGGPVRYKLAEASSLPLRDASFNLVFSSWMLTEQSSANEIIAILREAKRVLRPGGALVVVTNTADFYTGSWVSNEVVFPQNSSPLYSGQPVKVRLRETGQILNDYFWSDLDYKKFFQAAGFNVHEAHRPLASSNESGIWRDEVHRPPYVIYTAYKDGATCCAPIHPWVFSPSSTPEFAWAA